MTELGNKDPTAEPVPLPLGFLRSITDDFCNKRKLGEGAYGVVYKGILPCGSAIAVKKFHERFLTGDDRSFEDEASFLMDIEHQNVVKLLGYCAKSEGELMRQPNGKGIVVEQLTRMLCFEYMCNGGLDKHLSDESSGLEWNTRYKIIKGICHGLNFLHGCNIIHLDLKPENILMDDTMTPKIADFGLSRLLGEQKSYTVAGPSNRPGTPGYMAPEYIDRGIISKKADIFSLGVIVIRILKGCKADYPDYHRSTEIDFQQFTEKVLSNWRKRIFEGSSKYTSPELCSQLVKQCIEIALGCVHPNKDKRPDVSNIIEILNAAEESCYDQNGEDLPVDHQMEIQEGIPPSGVLREDGLVALTKTALKDHAQAWITKGMMKSAFAPQQPQCKPVLDGYHGARYASVSVAHNALASLESNLLKDWAATINIAANLNLLELQLISVKATLESTLGSIIHNSALERSLMMLQDLVYDAEDVVDKMEYFRIQDMLHAGQHVGALNLDLNVLPSISDEPPEMIFDRVDASDRMKHIAEQMQEVQQCISGIMKNLGSNWSMFPKIARSPPISTSESTEPKLYGRDLIMNNIIYDITKGKHSGEVLTVIPIVGPGGIGKTTLAQHIYHSGEVQEHFDVRVWTCVSLNFNVNKLTEEIQRYIPNVDRESSNGTASELIGQRLKNKRLFLVLDDIWDCSDEDEWKRLLVPFQKSQVQGNIIIVTTRFPSQAQIMARKKDHSICLQGLESKEFAELFLEIIFGDDDQSRKDHTFLLETGFRIAGRLKGSPLAAKTVGRLLKTQLDLVHWTRILESKEWENVKGKNDIMPALKLSFDYLPSQLQQCFSYCALFPQDYIFETKQLINFWIGQEVLHYSSHGENKRVEDIGLCYLDELVNYGFLENKEREYVGGTRYIIHDLLYELAQKVSSLECLSIDCSQSQVSSLKVLPSTRHLSINIDHTNVKDRLTRKLLVEDFTTLGTRLNVEKLRTLMIFGEHHGCFVKAFGDLFREAKALRLVLLSGATYDVKDLLHNFYCLIHLRYLQIEGFWPSKATFPSRISRFYHMKVLHAKDCDIDPLPADINNLVKLRHLLVHDTIHSSIVGVGKLISLQELRRFVVKQDDQGFELKQLRHLKELRGLLCIYNLENVQVKEEADEAKLSDKSHLKELILQWDNIDRTANDSTLEEHVLERLRPGSYLLKLSIKGHRGTTCPSWLGTNLSVKNLESLCLEGVAWKKFPPIGELSLVDLPCEENILGNIIKERFKNLRSLEICKLDMIEKWAMHASCQLFPFLEVLIIKDCPLLVELSFQHFDCCQQGKEVNADLFPRLSELKITNCPQLSSFPPVPWTTAPCSINIEGIGRSCLDKMVCEKNYRYGFRDGYSLTIEGNKDTNDSTFWNVLAFHNLTGLNELRMQRCQFLPLRYLQIMSSLRILQMSCSSNTFPFVEAGNHVKYQFPVEQLSIWEWNASGKELTLLLTYFPKLSDLQLRNCEKVTRLAVNVKGQRATETTLFSANKVEQQQDARAEDDVTVASEEAEHDLLLLPPQLQELEINKWPELSLLHSNPHDDSNGGGGGLQGISLRRLGIFSCPKLLSVNLLLLPPQLQELLVHYCPELSLLCSDTHDDSNEHGRSGGGGLRGTSLRQLKIYGCPKLLSNYSSSSFTSFPFPNSLEHLHISDYVGTEELPLSNLTSLTSLLLSHWPHIPSNSRGKGLLSLLTQGHLTKLSVTNMLNFFVDSDPSQVHEQKIPSCTSKLQELTIGDVPGFTAASLRHRLVFSSLTTLTIYNATMVERFTEEQEALLFVNSLEVITFQSCSKLQSIPERLHRLPNLKRLNIKYCIAIQMPPKDGLPSSLEELNITFCPEIQSLPKDCLPDSLQTLRIEDCGLIRSLPEADDLPSSLREIDVSISKSDKLKSHCRKLINIIPIVRT